MLQDSRAQMVEVFGSMERAKAIILRHWTDCAAHEDTARIDIEGMRAQDFEYPSGWLGALACQAAGMLGGNDAHGAMFDAVQWAHLHQHRNIGDAEVLLDIAESLAIHAAPSLTTCAATQCASACRPIVPKPLPSASVPYPP